MGKHILGRGLSALLLAAILQSGCQPVSRDASKAATPADAAANAACSWCPQASPPGCTLCVSHNPLLTVGDGGTGSTTLQLCNKSSEPIAPALSVSEFESLGPDGERLPTGASTRLLATVATDEPLVKGTSKLAAASCVAVTVEASKLWQAGALTASLHHGNDRLVELKAVRHPLPFKIKVDGPSPDKLELAFVKDEPKSTSIRLHNEDPVTYRFHWRLELGDRDIARGSAIALPGQRLALPVPLDDMHFSFLDSGFLRSGQLQGRLLLQHEPDPSFRLRPVEQQSYPVTARLSHWSPVAQGIRNSFWILVVLILGILISLLVNYILPTQRRRVALKQSLANQEGRLAGLGGVISSRRLNLLRTEKKRLRDELRGHPSWSPATEDALPKLETAIQALGHRIDLTVQAGAHLVALRDDPTIALPEAEVVTTHARTALEFAEQAILDETQLNAARAALDAAAQVRAASDDTPRAEAIASLQTQTDHLSKAQLPQGAEWQPFGDLLAGLRAEFPRIAVAEPTRDDYVAVARAVRKAQCALKFADLVEQSSGGGELRKRRLLRATELLSALLPGPNESVLRSAEIVREVEQNIDKEDLLEALKEPHMLRVEADPLTPIAYQLVAFRVKLARPGLDAANARNQIRCCWKVAGPGLPLAEQSLQDDSWTIWHYFEPIGTGHRLARWLSGLRGANTTQAAPSRFTVEATLYDRQDATRALGSASTIVELEPTKSYVSDSLKLSIGAMFVTVLLVGIGLLAGAQEKIQSLDWWSALVAVLVLGFGADALKRVLMKP